MMFQEFVNRRAAWSSAGKVQIFGQVSAPNLVQGYAQGGHASGVIKFAHVVAARIV